LLVERPAGILLGSACGIAAAFFVLPIRTERVIRARTAAALRALQSVVEAAPGTDELPLRARAFDRALAEVRTAAAPARLGGRTATLPDLLDRLGRPVRALAATPATPAADQGPALARTAANVGRVRRKLGRLPEARPPTPPQPHPGAPVAAPLAELNATLAALYAHL
ncbi:MAG: hypothetical protein QOF84_2961, partial [Streptomyces sp.]|nr:hypothetical protein [Streptomyces sp.]